MFSLVSGVYHWLFSRREVCILLVGLQGSGKTTFFEQLKERYARPGSKGTAGIRGRAAVGNENKKNRLQDKHANQQKRDELQKSPLEEDKWHEGRQENEKEQDLVCTNDHWRSTRQAREHEQWDFDPHTQEQKLGRRMHTVKPTRSNGSESRAYPLPQVSSTTGLNFCRFRYQDVDVILWDLAGLDSFHAIWVDYFQNAHCVLYFVDSTSSAEDMRKSRLALRRLTSAAGPLMQGRKEKHSTVLPPPLLVVAAKQDLAERRVPPAGEVRAVFSYEEENCCSSSESGEGQLLQVLICGDERTLSGRPHPTCKSNAVYDHSACSWDSVEELLRRAVHAAKSYYELLSLPGDDAREHLNGAEPLTCRRASYKLMHIRSGVERFPLHTFPASEAEKPNGHAAPEVSYSQPLRSGRRRVVSDAAAQVVARRSTTRSFPARKEKTFSISLPVDRACRSEIATARQEIPCWHYAERSAAPTTSMGPLGATYAPYSEGTDGDASQGNGVRSVSAAAARRGVPALAATMRESADTHVAFHVDGVQDRVEPQRTCSAASTRETKVDRETSGLYDLDDWT